MRAVVRSNRRRVPLRRVLGLWWGLFVTATATAAVAGETHVAVAANFTAAAREIAAAFAQASGHRAILSFGSTGKLYTQIANGAPFELLLAADQTRPTRLVDEGLGVAGSQFTYARGKIVLYSRDPELVDPQGAVLHRRDAFSKLAIANPKTAPYGGAAVEVLRGLAVYEAVAGQLVMGDNIAQTYQFVATTNAELGFVAYAQVVADHGGSQWLVPETLYTPIRQDAVLLTGGKANPVARAFLAFLRQPAARAIIQRFGYGLD